MMAVWCFPEPWLSLITETHLNGGYQLLSSDLQSSSESSPGRLERMVLAGEESHFTDKDKSKYNVKVQSRFRR